MHIAFNLNPGSENWSEYIKIGRENHERNIYEAHTQLLTFQSCDGTLNAQEIIDNWFPNINANVFLSHSHENSDLVIGLAGWLYQNFGLKSFIDSCVWGYSDKLLKLIDNEYCLDDFTGRYLYDKRNRSTSHVHMMLSTALMEMMDRCECVIFVNTPSSFTPKDYLNSTGRTQSPWIYSEIAMTSKLRKKSISDHRSILAVEAFNKSVRASTSLVVEYEVDTLHLTPLSLADLNLWKRSNKDHGAESLDSLYEMKAHKF